MINDNIDGYYTPILVRSSFENNFEEYEIRGNKNKNLSLKQYNTVITPHLTKLLGDTKNSTKDEQKVQLTMEINFRHVTNPSKNYTFYVKSTNTEMRNGDNTNDIFAEIFKTFLENYDREENILRNGSNFVFDSVDITYVQFHTIELKRGSSYIPSPEWVERKKVTINPKNKNDSFFLLIQ